MAMVDRGSAIPKKGFVYYPISSEVIKFRVRAARNAHIVLTSYPGQIEPNYELTIGDFDNNATNIKKSGSKTEEVTTFNILDELEFETFWLCWENATLACGRDGEKVFISWTDTEDVLDVKCIGFCTAWGNTGSWVINYDKDKEKDHNAEFLTDNKLGYTFIKNDSQYLKFQICTALEGHILLTTGYGETHPMYEVFLGRAGNTITSIRKNRTKPDLVEKDTLQILHANQFQTFWLRWDQGTIACGFESDLTPIVSCAYHESVPLNYVGFCTEFASEGSWAIIPEEAPKPQPDWVSASGGTIPPGAFVAGQYNGEPMYVIRAQYEGDLIPGHLVASEGHGIVPWKYKAREVTNYEVLCNFVGKWEEFTEGSYPPNSFSAGRAKDGEALYVGRVYFDGNPTIGKVQKSHGCCYTTHGGKEVSSKTYDVLVL